VRTTVDLDPDVDARLRALARERRVALRVVINDALRAGLRPPSGAGAQPDVLPSRRLGIRAGVNVDKALALSASWKTLRSCASWTCASEAPGRQPAAVRDRRGVVVHPTDRHLAILRELLGPLGTGGNLTTDAHLAAMSIEHGAQLCSSDADVSRFPGVRWHDPLRT
jgi:predicted nucleic acid-binding protein